MSKFDSSIPFPLHGKGLFLRFTLLDIAELEEAYGVGEYFEKIELNLNAASASVTLKCLDVGLKCANEQDRAVRAKIPHGSFDFPIAEAAQPILDALCLAINGKSYAEMIEEAARRQAEIEKEIRDMGGGEVADDPLPDSAEPND